VARIGGVVAAAALGVLAPSGARARGSAEAHAARSWKSRAVAELLGPMTLQFDRTRRAAERWKQRPLYVEVKLIKAGNEAIRALLLQKAHLIPPELLDDAGRLLEHYDIWLEHFERQRGGREPDLASEFTYAGPEGFPFPRDAEARFRAAYRQYWNELYGRH